MILNFDFQVRDRQAFSGKQERKLYYISYLAWFEQFNKRADISTCTTCLQGVQQLKIKVLLRHQEENNIAHSSSPKI